MEGLNCTTLSPGPSTNDADRPSGDTTDTQFPKPETELDYQNGEAPSRHMSGKFSTIALASGSIILPMVAFTIAIIVVVGQNTVNRLDPGEQDPRLVEIGYEGKRSVYYVKYPVATLAFVGSLPSKVVLSLISFFMVLVSFKIGQKLKYSSSLSEQPDSRPTPYQLSLLISLLAGSQFSALVEQSNETFIVSRVQKAAFGCLIAANVLYVLAAIVLLIIALLAARDKGVRDRQARLTISGAVVHGFEERRREALAEEMKELFEEWHIDNGEGAGRVSLVENGNGGIIYTVDQTPGSG